MERYTRRQMLRILGVTAAAGLSWKLGFAPRDRDLVAYSQSRVLMGTVVNLTVIGADEEAGRTAVAAALDRMAGLEAILSRHQPASECSRLNRHSYLENASQPLLDLVRQAGQISDLTAGAFDISMKPLLDLYMEAHQRGELPTEAAIAGTLPRVDHRHIRIRGRTISFDREGMGITLDGIGKGFIVDAGTAVLRRLGFPQIFVEAGGDLMACGEKADSQPWRIGILSPRAHEGAILARLPLRDQAAATSGDYMHAFSADFRHHHILDPRTGLSARALASATIIAPTAMLADGLSTAAMVLDAEAGVALAGRLPGVHAYLVDKETAVHTTLPAIQELGE